MKETPALYYPHIFPVFPPKKSVIIEEGGKCFIIRSECKEDCGKIF